MLCPVDNSEMIVVEYKNIEMDYCTHCRGVWFDAGELELLLDALGIGRYQQFLEAVLPGSAAGRSLRCPLCRRRLKEASIVKEPQQILIDACPQGDGVWFDGGEVHELVKCISCEAPDNASQQTVIAFMQEVFQAHSREDQAH